MFKYLRSRLKKKYFPKKSGWKIIFHGKKIIILSRKSLENGNKVQVNKCYKTKNPNFCSNSDSQYNHINFIHIEDWI